MRKLTIVLVASGLLAACDEAPEPAAAQTEEAPNVFEPLTQSLDRARAVEDMVREQEEELRRRIEEAEGR